MSIQLDERIVGLWFAVTGGKTGYDDVMMYLLRHPEGFQIVYRTRTSASADPWDDKDRKQWLQTVVADVDEAAAVRKCQSIMADILFMAIKLNGLKPPGIVHELLRGSRTLDQFIELFMELPFVHKKVLQ